MDPSEDIEIYASLRRLVVERPREARTVVDNLLDIRPPHLERLLLRIASPSEGRLRQVIANSIRAAPTRRDAVPQLAEWLASETDEFTKNALRAAIASPTASSVGRQDFKPVDPKPVDPVYVEAYRYAASRLTHKVRNAITEPQSTLLKFARLADSIPLELRDGFVLLTTELQQGLQNVFRAVEFQTDDPHFVLRQVSIMDWLRTMNQEYARRYESIDLTVRATQEIESALVLASDYYLDTIFWNIWINAHQAISERVHITIHASLISHSIQMLIIDNGEGFPSEAYSAAFVSQYSTKAESRGRGLLEVQDAVEKLRGDIRIVAHDGTSRIRLTLPIIHTGQTR